jgi:glycosyltransferase involved in cell wall biosynthesis
MISVVIPTYKHRDYVLQTLDSVFAQTYADYEVIVVNDGSPDDTAELLRPLAESGRIRYIEQENQGMSAARNRGIAEARGDFIALLDDDDLWPPDKLQTQVEAMRAHPGAVLVHGRAALLKPDGSTYILAKPTYPSGAVYEQIREHCWVMSPGQALIRTHVLRKVGGFDPGLWATDDWDLYIKLARQGEFLFVDRVCLFYRMHSENASRANAIRHVNNVFKLMRKHSGWDVPLMVRQLRFHMSYYVPHLRETAAAAHARGRYGTVAAAYLYTGLFLLSPVLMHLAHPRRIPPLLTRVVRSALRRPLGVH